MCFRPYSHRCSLKSSPMVGSVRSSVSVIGHQYRKIVWSFLWKSERFFYHRWANMERFFYQFLWYAKIILYFEWNGKILLPILRCSLLIPSTEWSAKLHHLITPSDAHTDGFWWWLRSQSFGVGLYPLFHLIKKDTPTLTLRKTMIKESFYLSFYQNLSQFPKKCDWHPSKFFYIPLSIENV